MINFACSNCAEPLEAPESLAGRLLNCPKCATPHIVPRPAEPQTPPPPAVAVTDAPHTGWPAMAWAIVLGVLMIIGGFLRQANDENTGGNVCGTVVFIGGWLLIFLGILIRIAGKILDQLEKRN